MNNWMWVVGKMLELFGGQTQLTVENMSFSGVTLKDFPGFVRALATVKLACASANHRVGDLDTVKFEAIARACRQVIAEPPLDQFPVDVFHGGGGIGINMNVNEVLAQLAGAEIDPVNDVNASQSTSDVCHTALRLTLIGMLAGLREALHGLEATLRRKASQFDGHQTIARTCLQDAMRVPAGVLFAATASATARMSARLAELTAELSQVNLGGTVIGTGAGASLEYRAIVVDELAVLSGQRLSLHPNLHDAAAYPDDLVRVSEEVVTIARLYQKLAQDLRLLSSGPETGFAELRLPSVQAGSSFFPGKVNPVVPEMMIQCAVLIAANHSAVASGFSLGETHLNVFEPMMGFLLMRNIQMLTKATSLFDTKCLAGIELNVERGEQYANAGIPSLLAAKERLGYRRVADLVSQVGVKQALAQLRAPRRTTSRATPNGSREGNSGQETIS